MPNGETATSTDSFTGYVFMLGGPISILTKNNNKKTVPPTDTEAEYMAMSKIMKKCIYRRSFLLKLGQKDANNITHLTIQAFLKIHPMGENFSSFNFVSHGMLECTLALDALLSKCIYAYL
ncbi:UNVERIFIED_CONTAM: hypothetical protein RMT77_013734 [Armadillidium vulgare]